MAGLLDYLSAPNYWLNNVLNGLGQVPNTSLQPGGLGSDPTISADGSYVPPAAMPTPAQAQASHPLQAVAHALVPALVGAPPGPPPSPPAASQPSQDSSGAPQGDLFAKAQGAQGPQDSPWSGVVNNSRNNPLNLRFAGQDGAANANGFASFPNQQAGISAAQNQFGLYAKRGVTTLRGLISTWAPPSENPTDKYLQYVSDTTGISPDAPINLADPAVQQKIIPAMSVFENGHQGAGVAGPQQTAQQANPAAAAAASATPTAQTMNPQQASQEAAALGIGGPSGSQSGLLYPNAAQLPKGSQMLALASGLLSGPNFGQGLGKGLGNMLQVQQAQRQGEMQANMQNIEDQRLQQQMDYERGVLGIRQQVANNGTQRTAFYTSPEAQAAKKAALEGATDATDDANEIVEGGYEAQQKQAQFKAINQFLSNNNVTPGPGLDSFKRMLGNALGVTIDGSDPKANQLLQAALSNERGSGIMGKNMRTQKEFNTVMEGLGNMDTMSKPALIQLMQGIENLNTLKMQMANQWMSLPQAERQTYRRDPDAMGTWRNGVIQKWQQGLDAGGGLYGQNTPGNIGYSGTTSGGIKYSISQ